MEETAFKDQLDHMDLKDPVVLQNVQYIIYSIP